MADKWFGFANLAERDACAEAKQPGTCCYVNEARPIRPISARQYWTGIAWAPLGQADDSVYPPGDKPEKPDHPPHPNSWQGVARTVRHKAGKSGAGSDAKGPYGLINNIELPFEAKEAWLSFEVFWPNNFDWDHKRSSGKIYGLSSRGDERVNWGQNGTGNCAEPKPESWSTRCTWGPGGVMELYAYHQNRPGKCGHKLQWMRPDGKPYLMPKDTWNLVRQRVKVNDVGKHNGEIDIWCNGTLVLSRKDMEWRGDTSGSKGLSEKAARALISCVKEQNYCGGNDPSGPRWDCMTMFRHPVVSDQPPVE